MKNAMDLSLRMGNGSSSQERVLQVQHGKKRSLDRQQSDPISIQVAGQFVHTDKADGIVHQNVENRLSLPDY